MPPDAPVGLSVKPKSWRRLWHRASRRWWARGQSCNQCCLLKARCFGFLVEESARSSLARRLYVLLEFTRCRYWCPNPPAGHFEIRTSSLPCPCLMAKRTWPPVLFLVEVVRESMKLEGQAPGSVPTRCKRSLVVVPDGGRACGSTTGLPGDWSAQSPHIRGCCFCCGVSLIEHCS